jgi:Helix-hairpin-helix domain
MIAITSIKGIGPHNSLLLKKNGFSSIKDIAEASIEQLQVISGFGAVRAAFIIEEAIRLLAEQMPSAAPTATTPAPPEPELELESIAAAIPESALEIKKGKKKKKKKAKKEKKKTGVEKSSKKEKKRKKDSDKKKKKKKK